MPHAHQIPALALSAVACALPTVLPAQEIARTVPTGREIRDSKLLTLGKTDRWDLEIRAGEILHCRVQSGAFDPVLELVDSDGNVLAHNDGEGTESTIRWRGKHDGPVAFRVHGYDGRGGGQYTFWLERFRTATLPPGTTGRHTFGAPRWWHYTMPLAAGDVLVPTAWDAARITAVLDPGGRRLADVLGGYRAPVDGDYVVRIEGRRRQVGCFAWTKAARRDRSAAAPMHATVASRGLDIWQLRLKRGEAYALSLDTPRGSLKFDLREAVPQRGPAFVWTDGIQKGGQRRRWLVARRDCAVEILLQNTGAATAPYRMDLRAPATPLPMDARGTAAFTGALPLGDGQLFQLDTRPGQLLRIGLRSRAFDGQLALWDPDGGILAQSDDRGPLDRNPELTFLITRPGIHRLLATCPSGQGCGPFELEVTTLPVPTLTTGEPVTMDVGERGSEVCYLHLDAGKEIWLSIRSKQCDVACTVIAPDGHRVGTFEGGGIGGNVLAAIEARHTGRYTLQIHSRKGAGDCTLRAIEP